MGTTRSTINVIVNSSGKAVKVEFEPKGDLDQLIFILDRKTIPALKELAKKQNSEELAAEAESLKKDVDYLEEHLDKLGLDKGKKGKLQLHYTTHVPEGEDAAAVSERISTILNKNQLVLDAIEHILKTGEKPATKGKEHKQSRSLAKTVAWSTGKETKQRSLFEMPLAEIREHVEMEIVQKGGLFKERMSHKTSVLAQMLAGRYDVLTKDKDGLVVIDDIGALAEELGTSIQELKVMLFYLGGYQYTHVVRYTEEKEVGVQVAKLFTVEFVYDENIVGRIDLTDVTSIGNTLHYIKNERIKKLKIKPTAELIRDLKGNKKALGYIRVNDGFIAALLELSQMAYKLMNYSISNTPKWNIRESKLFEALGLMDQVKAQGKGRIQRQVREAIDELIQKGHFTKYDIKPGKDGENVYSWHYSDKYVKHQQELLKGTDDGEFIDYKDKAVPVDKRRARYKEWAKKDLKMSDDKAWELALKKIPE